MDSLFDCNSDIPILISAGNRDIGNDQAFDESFLAWEKQAMELFFHFQFGGRHWVSKTKKNINLLLGQKKYRIDLFIEILKTMSSRSY